jgi:hypothetical protein
MTSNIDPTIPVEGSPTTASVRANFAEAAAEITALQQATNNAPFLSLSGGTMTGALSLSGDPTSPLNPVTLNYFNAHAVAGGIPEAPSNGNTYARLNASWVQVPTLAQMGDNAGRNLIDNSMMIITQRGQGPWTTAAQAYTADRWKAICLNTVNTFNVNIVAASDADRTAIGDEQCRSLLSFQFGGDPSPPSYVALVQFIDGVTRTANKTVTVSFWARAVSNAIRLGVSLDQNFGTGSNSPSAQATGNGQVVTLSTTMQRYSLTFAVPSIAGKTIGSNQDDTTELNFWMSAGSNYNARSGGVGYQSGTTWIWGVQAEIGTQATQLEKISPQQEMLRAQRCYQLVWLQWLGYCTIGQGAAIDMMYPVAMRGTPSNFYITWSGQVGATGGIAANGSIGFQFSINNPTANQVNIYGYFFASAEP